MTVTISVNNVWSRISGLKDIEAADYLDKVTSFYIEGYQYTKAFRDGWYDQNEQRFKHWDGKKHLLTSKMVFPTGLLSLVVDFFNTRQIPFEIDDRRPTFQTQEAPIFGHTPRQYQIDAVDAALSNERGIIRVATGGGKCLRLGTKVLKYNGTICKVEELKAGDLLMGPDSESRMVLSTNIQYGNIFKIIPIKGSPWYCNDEHILTLKHTVTNNIIDINIKDFLNKKNGFRNAYKQFSVGINFKQEQNLPIDPYFLGIWFGDGNKSIKNGRLESVGITTADSEIVDKVYKIAQKYEKKITIIKQRGKASRYHIVGKKGMNNSLSEKIINTLTQELKVPYEYLVSSRENRLEFLAGWLDTDGYLHNNSYEIVQKRKDWAEAVAFLARSLGFRALISLKHDKKFNLDYYKVSISGEVSEIPVRIDRKKATKRIQKKDVLKTGFKIEPAGQDYYVGLELDGDGRFLLEDFTVTHNTKIAAMITAKYNLPTIIYVVGKDLLYQFHNEFQKTLDTEIGIIGDGNCKIRRFNICSVWTAATAFEFEKKISIDDEDWAPEICEIGSQQKKEIKNMIENSNVAIYDEAHFLATDTLQSIYKAGKNCRYLFGLSGTDWRDDGADLLLESVCGPRIFNLTASDLIEKQFLVPANIVVFDVPTKATKSNKNYNSIYSEYIINNDIRNGMIVDSAKNLLNKGRKVLILVRYLSHGNIISNMLGNIQHYFVNGEIDAEERKRVKQEFEEGRFNCLIASTIYDIGIDIPVLDSLILAGSGKSSVRALQRIGRVIRGFAGKKDAIVVDFFDNAKFLDKHSAIRISVYETEPRFKIKLPKNFDQSKIKRSRKIIQKVTS